MDTNILKCHPLFLSSLLFSKKRSFFIVAMKIENHLLRRNVPSNTEIKTITQNSYRRFLLPTNLYKYTLLYALFIAINVAMYISGVII